MVKRPPSINPFAKLANIQQKRSKKAAPYTKKELRHFIFSQNPTVLAEVRRLAKEIQQLPQDPRYPNTKPQAFLSGGCVRDAILGIPAKDADLEVYGVSPKNLLTILHERYPKVSLVGESFAVLKVRVQPGLELDISLPRREKKSGTSHNDFIIESDPGMSLEEASHRRDFTINALLADPLTGEVLDFHQGLEDLKHRILRITDPVRFEEDELRVLRGVQLAGRMNLTVEPTTWNQFLHIVKSGRMKMLSPDRVREEYTKLLTKSAKPSIGLELLQDLGIFEQEYPVFFRIAESAHAGDQTWNTLLRRVDAAASIIQRTLFAEDDAAKKRIMFATLCADIVDAPTNIIRTSVENIPSTKGKQLWPIMCLLLRSWNHSHDDAMAIYRLIREHHQPYGITEIWRRRIVDDQNYANFVRMLLKRLFPGSIDELLAVSEAEWQATTQTEPNTTYLPAEKLRATITQYNLDTINPKSTLITGTELQQLGVPTGPRIGALLQMIEDMRDTGRIVTREDAFIELHKLISP